MAWVDGQIEMTGAAGGVQTAYAGTGKSSLQEIIGGLVEGGVDELAGAIYEEMETIKGKSQDIVPYRDGTLEASADAVGVNVMRTGMDGFVAIGYGGAAWAYSVIQHQTPPPGEGVTDSEGKVGLEFRHAAGRSWKYLEKPVLAAIEGMDGRLAARVRARMAAR